MGPLHLRRDDSRARAAGTMTVAGLIETLEARSPLVVSLAEAVSLAVRVEPELVRRARLTLVPDADASAEADLWFSPLVDVQSSSAFMLLPDVAEALRARLARNRARLESAWTVTSEVHANAAPAVALEEEVNYLALAEGPESPVLQRRLEEAVVALVQGGEDRLGVARWASRALARLPAAVARSEAGLMLTVAARSRLGHTDVLPEGVTPETEWLPWVLPRDREPVRIGVRLLDEGLELGAPDESLGHVIPLPDTDPVVLHVSWPDGPDERRRYVRVRPDRVSRIRVANGHATKFTLRTAWGDSYVIRPRTAPASIEIRAHAGGRTVLVAWRPGERTSGCLGFALRRRTVDGAEQVVENPVGFAGPSARPSTAAPFQRGLWLDESVSRGVQLQYSVAPVFGTPDELHEGDRTTWTDPVTPSTLTERGLHLVFNRGVLGLAGFAARLGGQASTLPQMLSSVGSEARDYLGGDLKAELTAFLTAVREGGGTLRAALFELDDPEALLHLGELGPRAQLLVDRTAFDRNPKDFELLTRRGVDVQWVGPGKRLFHHRFAVACDESGAPERVWIGGANWTTTGLFLQASNAIIAESRELAGVFFEQWQRLRARDNKPSREPSVVAVGPAKVTVWFSPQPGEPELHELDSRIASARSGVLFAVGFAPRFLDRVQSIIHSRHLYVRGALAGLRTTPRGVTLFDGAQTQNVAFSALASSEYRKELSLTQFGEFLARMIVIDPFDRDGAVVTGSHNLSSAASARSHDTLLVVERAPAFAAAHAVHVLELYQHYAFRAAAGKSTGSPPELRRDDGWQERIFGDEGRRELDFWVGRRP